MSTVMKPRRTKRVFRIPLIYDKDITHSAFVRAFDRPTAEERALRQHPEAKGIDRRPYPQG